MAELEYAVSKIKWDIVGLSEVRREGCFIEDRREYTFYNSGKKKGEKGVGFVVKNNNDIEVEDFIPINERIAILKVRIQQQTYSIIQLYAPTEKAPQEEIDEFYEQLEVTMGKCNKNVICMGDMNAKVGEMPAEDSYILGKYGYGSKNKRGEAFIHFCQQHNLSIMNTKFKKPQKMRWTWKSPDGVTKNQIDYFTTNIPKLVEDVSVLNNFLFPSDHRIIRATINIKSQKPSRKRYNKVSQKTDISKLQANLAKNLNNANHDKPLQEFYDGIEKSIIDSCKNTIINKKENKRNAIMTPEIKEQIYKRQQLKNKERKTVDEKLQLSVLYRKINRNIKANIENYRLTTIQEYLEKSGGVNKAYKKLNNTKQQMTQLKSTSGSTVTNRHDLMQVATQFYKNLYHKTEHHSEPIEITPRNTDTPPLFTESEVEFSINKLKTGKSPGSDRINNEQIMAGKEMLTKPLTKLFNQVLEKKVLPRQWTVAEITLLYKKGDAKQITNYRPISLLSSLYKLFASTLLRRITRTVDENQPVEQAGFMRGFSTVDHIHTLKNIIEKYNEYGKSLYIGFVDYAKAFDSISHSSIWNALSEQGVNASYIDIIKELYKNSTARVKLESSGPEFKIERGVKQGDPLSPKLFVAVLESIFRSLDWDEVGLKIHGRFLSHLRFADDIVLLSENVEELQYMFESLNSQSKKVGLEINQEKTKVMTNSCHKPITLESSNLEYVDDYIYLGHLISFNNVTTKEINRRVENTWKKYWSMKEIFKSTLPIKLKTKAMEICLLPCLTYACQTWSISKKVIQKVRTCQRGIERSYLGLRLKDKVNHAEIRQQTKARDVIRYTLKQKWRWAGHIQRTQDERWSSTVTNWYPFNKKRKRGRPHKRWSDDIAKIAGRTWTRLARDRHEWHSKEEAFTALGGPYI